MVLSNVLVIKTKYRSYNKISSFFTKKEYNQILKSVEYWAFTRNENVRNSIYQSLSRLTDINIEEVMKKTFNLLGTVGGKEEIYPYQIIIE